MQKSCVTKDLDFTAVPPHLLDYRKNAAFYFLITHRINKISNYLGKASIIKL